jgi:3-dehydroquinate dehydratase II
MNVLVIHGPNLDLLGTREPEVYGRLTLAEIDERLAREAERLGIRCASVQHNSEGGMVEELHRAAGHYDGIVLNPAAFTHYAYALRDAIAAIGTPTVEVHLTNPAGREEFRSRSVVAGVCCGSIAGFGVESYCLALRALASLHRG